MTYNRRNQPVATWLEPDDRAKLEAIAKAHKVTVAALLRAMVVDALNEDNFVLSAFVPPDGRIQYCAHFKVTPK